MENSSKALLIAGAILIVILLVTISIKILSSPRDTINQAQTVGDGLSIAVKDAAEQIESSFVIQREPTSSESIGEVIQGTVNDEINNGQQEETNTLKKEWIKTSTGDLAIGSTVKHIEKEEEFYVIGGDTVGRQITNNTKTVILLAKNNLKADELEQDPTGETNPCAFCTETAWNGASVAENDDLNTKATIKEDTTSAVYKAIKYGESLGATGRLMLKSEADELNNDEYKDILYGKNGKSSGAYLYYWLGSAYSDIIVWFVDGDVCLFSDACFFFNYYRGATSC